MNLTQIIEKSLGEFDKIWPKPLTRGHEWPDERPIRSFLSEKIKEAYEAGKLCGVTEHYKEIGQTLKKLS